MSKTDINTIVEPLTIFLLKNLEPGQKLSFYTGHLETDIRASGGRDGSDYGRLLWDIQKAAYLSESQGRKELSERQIVRSVRDGGVVTLTEYTARGRT